MLGYSLIKTNELKAYRQFFIDMKNLKETSEINWAKIKELTKLFDEGKITSKEYNEETSKIIQSDHKQQNYTGVKHE